MNALNRRSALMLGVMAASGGTAAAQTSPVPFYSDDTEADAESGGPELLGRTSRPRTAVEFWNSVALNLVAIDHTIAADDARAIGPVATARALGLVHIVIADAVASAYPRPLYKPFRATSADVVTVSSPAVFVGGAAAAILEHIYSESAHTSHINAKRREFLNQWGRRHLAAWKKGLEFGRKTVYQDDYRYDRIKPLIDPANANYSPGPQQHDVDPLNPDQGFYGSRWGLEPKPFGLSDDQVTNRVDDPKDKGCAPPNPPAIGSADYNRSLEDVQVKGRLRGDPKDPTSITRTPQQEIPGLFWAYDGPPFLGTPPRLYNQVIVAIAQQDGLGPRRLARLLALSNVAMSDAGNVAWYAKYKHKYWRPVLGLNPNLPKEPKADDIKWIPLGSPRTNRLDFASGADPRNLTFAVTRTERVPTAQTFLGATRNREKSPLPEYADAAFTPNFPAYPSGHATFGAACFEVLRLFRKEEGIGTSSRRVNLSNFVSEELDGESIDNFVPRERPLESDDLETIQELKDDNGNSRVYLGVHWDFDSTGGIASGDSVATVIHGKLFSKV